MSSVIELSCMLCGHEGISVRCRGMGGEELPSTDALSFVLQSRLLRPRRRPVRGVSFVVNFVDLALAWASAAYRSSGRRSEKTAQNC